jgi:hypothetical protein
MVASRGFTPLPRRVYTPPNATEIADFLGVFMSQDQVPGTNPGGDALSGIPEPWETWETALVLGSIGVGVLALVVLGWAVAQFILP